MTTLSSSNSSGGTRLVREDVEPGAEPAGDELGDERGLVHDLTA